MDKRLLGLSPIAFLGKLSIIGRKNVESFDFAQKIQMMYRFLSHL